MGCTSSKTGSAGDEESSNSSTTSRNTAANTWRKKETKKATKERFYIEGSIPAGCSDELLELRVYLDEPELLAKLGKYAHFHKCLDLLLCWADLLEFSVIPEVNLELQVSKALFIHKRYLSKNLDSVIVPFVDLPPEYGDMIMAKIRETLPSNHVDFAADEDEELVTAAVMNNLATSGSATSGVGGTNTVGSVGSPAETGTFSIDLAAAAVKAPAVKLSKRMFDAFQHECLNKINTELFAPFKLTPAYRRIMKEQSNYNHVRVNDFAFYNVLGCGTFGFVVRCKKRSTGVFYAMKIQTKAGLLDSCLDHPERVTLEKDALATCHHPFIISMDYALQTASLAMMVMDIGTAGTLLDALKQCENYQMPLDRVVFYTAEISLALMHIHRLGMIYRDLKPGNVLLNEDGHIQLVDMGGVVDVGGNIAGYHDASEVMGGLFAQDYDSTQQSLELQSAGSPVRGGGTTSSFLGGVSSLSRKMPVSSLFAFGSSSQEDLSPARSPGGGLFSVNSSANGSASTGSRIVGSFGFGNHSGGVAPSSKIQSLSGRYKTQPGMSYKMAVKPDLKRANTIMGSVGFMPPEMLILEHQREDEQIGYSHAADFWSLGVTVYKLLTGTMPFDEQFSVAGLFKREGSHTETQSLAELVTVGRGNDICIDCSLLPPEYAEFVTKLEQMRTIPWFAINFILGMLEPHEELRLGCGKDGSKAVKFHKFFTGIPWHLLEQKEVTPPFLPNENNNAERNIVNVVGSNSHKQPGQSAGHQNQGRNGHSGEKKKEGGNEDIPYESFSVMMADLNIKEWAQPATKLIPSEQQYFATWDFVSPTVLKLEMGFASGELNPDGMADEFGETPSHSQYSRLSAISKNSNITTPVDACRSPRRFSTGMSLTALGFDLASSHSSKSGETGEIGTDIDTPHVMGMYQTLNSHTGVDNGHSSHSPGGSASDKIYRGNSEEPAPAFRNKKSGSAQNRANSGGKILSLLSKIQNDEIEESEKQEFVHPQEEHQRSYATGSNASWGTHTNTNLPNSHNSHNNSYNPKSHTPRRSSNGSVYREINNFSN